MSDSIDTRLAALGTEEKADLVAGEAIWTTKSFPAGRHSRYRRDRWAQRGPRRRPLGHRHGHGLHSGRGGAGGDVGSRAGRAAGRGTGRRGPGQGVSGAVGPHHQSAPQPAGRAQFRVLQRGPDSVGADRRVLRAGGAIPRRGHHAQALRGQRLRVRAQHHRLPGGRANAARAVPGAVRVCCA